MQSKHLFFLWKKTSAPLFSCSSTHSRDCWQEPQPGEWFGLCCTSFRTVLPLPKPSISTSATWHSPCHYSVTQPQFPQGQSRGNGRQWASAGVEPFPQGSVTALLARDGFDKIHARGRKVNQDNFPGMLLIILRPRI